MAQPPFGQSYGMSAQPEIDSIGSHAGNGGDFDPYAQAGGDGPTLPGKFAMLKTLTDADIAREGEMASTMVRAGLLRDLLDYVAQPTGDAARMREAAAKVADDAEAMRIALFEENESSINAHKAVQAQDIARAIRALPSQEVEPAAGDGDGRVSITREMFDFLCGAGSLEGYYFGDKHEAERGTWWWRKRLAMAQAASPTGAGAGRWAGVPELVEQITAEEGATVAFTGPNPDFNGQPNEVVHVVRGPDWKEEWFRADTLSDCLRQALSTPPAALDEGEV